MFKLVMWCPALRMSAGDVEDFFYPFAIARISQGTGYDAVDLPTSKILVEKHGGEIDVRLQNSGDILIHLSLPLTSIPLVAS